MDNGEGSYRNLDTPEIVLPEGSQQTEIVIHQTPPPGLQALMDADAFARSPSPFSAMERGTSPEHVGGGEQALHDEDFGTGQHPDNLSVISQVRRSVSELHIRAVFNAHRNRVVETPAPADLALALADHDTDSSHQEDGVPSSELPSGELPAGPSFRLPPIRQALTASIFDHSVVLPPIWGTASAGPARRSFSLPPPSRRQESGAESQDSRVPSLMMLATAALGLSPADEGATTPPANIIEISDDEEMTDEVVDVEEDPLPPALPAPAPVHNQWVAVFVRTSICDVCDTAGHPVVQRCTARTCGWQVCRPCIRAGRLDARHTLDEEGVTWIDPRPGSRRARARRTAQEE